MIKPILRSSAAILCSLVVANAATYITSPSSTSINKGNGYYGFAMNLASSVVTTTPSSGASSFSDLPSIYLQKIEIQTRPDGTAGNPFKIAVYSYTGNGDVGNFLGLSNNIVTPSIGQFSTLNFDNILLGQANATYQFLFVTKETQASDLTDEMSSYKAHSATANLTLVENTSLPNGSGTYKTSNNLTDREGNYLPKVNITTVDSIPEPSSVGLLAGAGLFSLIGIRRRKKN